MTDQDFQPLLFASTNELPKELSAQGLKVAKLITLLESKGFFGGISIEMQSGKITNSGFRQTIRI